MITFRIFTCAWCLYKRIASAGGEKALADLKVELIDRFGLLPEPTRRLFDVTELKIAANALGIRKIDAAGNGGYMVFDASTPVDPAALIRLVESDVTIRLHQGDRLRFALINADIDERIQAIRGIHDALAPGNVQPAVAS